MSVPVSTPHRRYRYPFYYPHCLLVLFVTYMFPLVGLWVFYPDKASVCGCLVVFNIFMSLFYCCRGDGHDRISGMPSFFLLDFCQCLLLCLPTQSATPCCLSSTHSLTYRDLQR